MILGPCPHHLPLSSTRALPRNVISTDFPQCYSNPYFWLSDILHDPCIHKREREHWKRLLKYGSATLQSLGCQQVHASTSKYCHTIIYCFSVEANSKWSHLLLGNSGSCSESGTQNQPEARWQSLESLSPQPHNSPFWMAKFTLKIF